LSSSATTPSARSNAAAAVVLHIADRPGPTFLLNPDRDNTLGRSPDATIVVPDRLASRIHAVFRFDAQRDVWTLHDLGSRNGTAVNGAAVTQTDMTDGATVRVGTTELFFKQLQPAAAADLDRSQFARCKPVAELEGSVLRRVTTAAGDETRRPLVLYQASVRLLASQSERDVIGTTLEIASQHSNAASVGWFRVTDHEGLEPACVVPPGNPLAMMVADSMARLVVKEGNALWTAARERAGGAPTPEIACVPVMVNKRVHAALVAAAAPGSTKPVDFDFLVALASLASAACAGHVAAGTGRNGVATDLSSLLTVDIDAVGEEEEGLRQGTIALDETRLQELGLTMPEPSPSMARIASFVAETATLRLDEWQRVLVIEALRRTSGSVPNAAAELGISRAMLCRTLEHYGLTRHG
jgi:pSer/pThr/pTyr-binding forkhead associated (FHA) protein